MSGKARITPLQVAVLAAPFWGLSPESNRWGDFNYVPNEARDDLPIFDGDDVREAIKRGWLTVERHNAPGLCLDDPDEGGQIELFWRYHAVPAFQTIFRHYARADGVTLPW